VSDEEKLPPEAWIIASLKEILVAQNTTNERLQSVENKLTKSTIHLKYKINLTVAHTNELIADFTKLGVEIDNIHILPVPSAISIRLRGMADETVDLEIGDDYTLSGHVITQILVTNEVGTGTAEIHVYGR
jgi:hypothetical protein